ncbi:Putative cryptic loci regulator 2 [Colletotrichum destructivum]|uniref:Cryptic loci regulator 2 n=1 Tax=Colletotrichum destructivum TaxID=34406 RepID=A0AAX4IBC7_9PEZI|nr:Putative cryptic loci regulator 2 [Colletotrichum destructivum]
MSDLTEYNVVVFTRSDGQDYGPGYWPAPTDAAAKNAKKTTQEKTPRAKPQMVRLTEDDPRFQEWRIKLGILLKQELAPTEGLPWLVNFPRGYWLYEKSKHLWVSGHPDRSRPLYKSPQEFGIHLLWLLSNSNDRNDCRCVHCNTREMPNIDGLSVVDGPRALPTATNAQPPSKIRKITPQIPPGTTASPVPAAAATPPAVKRETPVPAPTTAAKKETPIPVPTIPLRAAPAQTSAQAQPPLQQQQSQYQHQHQALPSQAPPAQTQGQPPNQAPVQPQAQPQVQAQVQHVNQAPPQAQPMYQQPQFLPYPQPYLGIQAPTLFRVGELVWFQIASGWRLGIVAVTPTPTNIKPGVKPELQILPMSHQLFNQSPIQTLEATARPFLAFSVPNVSIPELQNKAYDEVNWEAFLRSLTPEDTHRREVALLDSSKMAAQKVGVSFSVFSRLGENEGGKKVDYHGIFLGAERIELGDVLRVRISPEQNLPPAANNLPDALLALREICTAPIDVPGMAFFKGDIYQPLSGDNAPATDVAMTVPEDKLPRPLREEMVFRKKFAPADRWRCVLLKQNAVLREPDLKGRFYATHRLLPLLDGQAKAASEAQKGIVRDVQQRLNQRIDTFKTAYIGQKRTRAETIGPALPPGSVLQFEASVREEGA